jgi:hypothetical protein
MKPPFTDSRILQTPKAGSVMVLGLLFVCGAAAAQDTSRIEQIDAAAGQNGRTAPIEQVSSSTSTRTILAPPRPVAPPPLEQLSSDADRVSPTRQLTDADRDAKAPVQLYEGGPTAQPPQALSQRSEGRTGSVTPVEGDDACDAAEADTPEKAKLCRRVIETRAAEFRRPDPTQLSPEQRLLIQQRLREGSTTASATRRLVSDGDADSMEGLAVASIVLGSPQSREERPVDPAEEAAADAAAALVTAIIGQTSPTPTPD